jgi:excisionase family DNA binding protein
MPTIRPYNAEKGRPKRPNLAEEISFFNRSILRHSRGGVTIADSIPLHELSGSNPPQEAPPECRTSASIRRLKRSRQVHLAPYRAEEIMENTSNILTVKEVANILRCSKAHVHNAIHGKVQGLPKLTHLTMGRRKLVRRDWLEQWLETNKTR